MDRPIIRVKVVGNCSISATDPDNAVKIKLQLTWVTFAIGTWWSALGVGCWAWRREEKAEVGCR